MAELDQLLRQFYASLRTADGSLYSKSTFVGIRAAISRHLRSPPHSKSWSILDNAEFHKSNTMFKSVLRKLKKDGLDKTQHRSAMSESDLHKLRSSGLLSNDNPQSLLRKVWFDFMLTFARRGRENLRELKASAFAFKQDDTGSEYVELTYNEATKNHTGDNLKDKDFESHPRMYATNDATCPIKSLRLYLAKRNTSNDIFFQQPRTKLPDDEDAAWYTSRPVGQRMLTDMMRNLSKEAELSQIYTNHSIRATTITLLSHAGVEAREIMRISGHRSEQSIRSYNTDSSDAQKRCYNAILHGNPSSSSCTTAHTVTSSAALGTVVPQHAQPVSTTSSHPTAVMQVRSDTTINNQQQNIMPLFQRQFEIHGSSVQINNYFSHGPN